MAKSNKAKSKAPAKAAKAAKRAPAGKLPRVAKAERRRDERAKKAGGPLAIRCSTCRAAPGIPCFRADGGQLATPHAARIPRVAPKPIGKALAPLVAGASGNVPVVILKAPAAGKSTALSTTLPVTRMNVADIKVGKRHRKDFGDLRELAQSIDDRGGLLQPIAVTSKGELIGGERRLRAWALTRFAGQPIPVNVIDVDSVLRGEWDENAQRKAFTLAESVALKQAIERTLRNINRKITAERSTEERAAPGRKARGAAGRTDEAVAKITGVKRETMRKAEAVVEAAKENPELFGGLAEQMDKTGNPNAAFKKLKVMKARAAIAATPPTMPANIADCATWVIDFPWAENMEKDQAVIDAAGRSFRPYPEMSIKSVCAFAHEHIAPKLPRDVAVWLLVTNFIVVRGYHMHVYEALGLKPANASTMLTWGKDKFGNGQILRDQTEHAILLTRGQVTIDVFGENPPSTLLLAPRRENSRKPDELWRLIERVTPAAGYASIFSQGGEGKRWLSFGDQVGKFAAPVARAAEAALLAEAKAGDTQLDLEDAIAGTQPIRRNEVVVAETPAPLDPPESDEQAPAQADDQRDGDETAAGAFDVAAEHLALKEIMAGGVPSGEGAAAILARRGLAHVGTTSVRLTNLGKDRLAKLDARTGAGSAGSQGSDEADVLDIPDFLRRTPAAA